MKIRLSIYKKMHSTLKRGDALKKGEKRKNMVVI
jgi:hypothetical protein